MIEIDGSKGGGQMLRTALTLSVVRQESFRMENIRGSRSNPGLKNQHLECVKTAQRISDAEIEGDEIGSEELVFEPQELNSDPFTANIGTAGSITLLYDTVLPITSQFDSSFRLTAKGGTDVKWSPTFAYLKNVKLPLISEFGFSGELELEKTGYYPTGGGEAILETEEHSLDRVELTDRGELERFEIYSKASLELKEQNVADRQADEAERMLKNSHISVPVEKQVEYEKTDSTGSSLLIKAVYENSVAGFDTLGEKGKRSEEVAKEAVQGFKKFHSSEAAVDEYMADQLLVFMAIIGGELTIPEITSHVETNLEVIRKFGVETDIQVSKDFVSIKCFT
jgi:RNA 3'-terminal phosphate cyclase (ATP)